MKQKMKKQSRTLGEVLKDWRLSNAISLYAIAKEEKTRIENIVKVEEGDASMVSLARYLDFVYQRDDVFFDKILMRWSQAMVTE